jgi:uncharacterized protein YhaN
MLMALAAMLTALYGVWRQVQETRDRRRQVQNDETAAAEEAEQSAGRLGLEERQWVLRVAHADNQRLRAENDELRATVRDLERRFEDLEARWRLTELTNERLQTHVERCEAEVAALKKSA